MKVSTINKAYQILVKRINSACSFPTYDDTFWNHAQPAFQRTGNGKIKLSLVYKSHTGYEASICDAKETPIACILTNDDYSKINPWLKYWSTMRQCKANLSNDDFKRIWLMAAISSSKDLYKLGHAGKPFLKAGETIESLALEYDLNAKA